jgi:hypothetical protein
MLTGLPRSTQSWEDCDHQISAWICVPVIFISLVLTQIFQPMKLIKISCCIYFCIYLYNIILSLHHVICLIIISLCCSHIIIYTHAQIMIRSNDYFITWLALDLIGLFFSRFLWRNFLNAADLLSMIISQTYQHFQKFYKTYFLYWL